MYPRNHIVWTLRRNQKWWDLRQAQGETRKFAPILTVPREDNLEAVTRRQVQSRTSRILLSGALTEIARSFRMDQ